MRPALLAAVMTAAVALVGLAVAPAPAQEPRLPDIGSSAGTLISPSEQERYGAMLLSQLRHYGYTLDDPLVEGWLQQMGGRLAATSDRPGQPFSFFLLKDRKINAFATLGGYIGLNAGLVLEAQREDEVAAVLAHEIAHVTQLHVLRAVERAQRDSIPILLAMLGAIAVAQSAGGSSAGEASQAALAVGMGLMQQRQIDYTRSNESEADRIGIQTLARGGYEPEAMADFFERMLTAGRGNSGGYQVPDFLRTHPVTTTRVSEARQRVGQAQQTPDFTQDLGGGSGNPMLPGGMRLPQTLAIAGGASGRFDLARERLRVLSADSPSAALREYRLVRDSAGRLEPAQRYGLAVAQMRDNATASAVETLAALLAEHPGDAWIELTLAEAEARAGRHEAGDRRFESLLARMPRDPAVAITYAAALAERKDAGAGRRAQDVLRPLHATAAADPSFQRTFARASEVAGDPVRAGEAWAEVAFLTGRPEQALLQLETLKKRPEVDYYARARIDARIAAITPVVLELRRQGVRDEVLKRG